MIAKQKISALAKAINIPGKEIAAMLGEVAGITKSSAASLDADEMSIVMEYYTQKFDDGSTIEEYVAAYQEKAQKEQASAKPKKEKKEEVLPEITDEEITKEITPQKNRRYVDTRTNAVDLDVQLAKEKAEELAPEIKDTETNKQRIKKNKNKQQPQKKNQPKPEEMMQKPKKEKVEKLHVVIPDTIKKYRKH